MTDTPYVPAAGFRGKLQRAAARIMARQTLAIDLDKPLISFTFDDFPKSAVSRGAARLEDEGWRATYFASGGFAGRRTHHGDMFDADDVRRLSGAGHEIACHTFSHTDAASSDTEAFVADVERNAAFLNACGQDEAPASFAFPYGEATASAKRALTGRFRALRGVRPGVNRGQADRALLRASPLDGGLDGLHRAIDAVRSATLKPGWLIFYGHDIQDLPTPWGCTPEFFDAVVDAVKSSGAQVMTMRAALDHIEGGRS